MFFVGFYPTGAAIVADTDYFAEKDTNVFFAAGTPVTAIATSDLTLFQVDGVTHADFKIGATGVLSKITATLASAAS